MGQQVTGWRLKMPNRQPCRFRLVWRLRSKQEIFVLIRLMLNANLGSHLVQGCFGGWQAIGSVASYRLKMAIEVQLVAV